MCYIFTSVPIISRPFTPSKIRDIAIFSLHNREQSRAFSYETFFFFLYKNTNFFISNICNGLNQRYVNIPIHYDVIHAAMFQNFIFFPKQSCLMR